MTMHIEDDDGTIRPAIWRVSWDATRIAELEAELRINDEKLDDQTGLLLGERESRKKAEAALAHQRGRREAAEVILREMAKLYAGQIDNTGNYCNQLHDSARAHFARYAKD